MTATVRQRTATSVVTVLALVAALAGLGVLLGSVLGGSVAAAGPAPTFAGARLPAGAFLGGELVQALAARLELDDEQRQEIRAILVRNLPLLEVHLGDVVDTRRALFATIHQHPPVEADVRAAAADVADAEVELAVLRAEIVDEIHGVLTPEQQDELADALGEVQGVVENLVATIGALARLRLGA